MIESRIHKLGGFGYIGVLNGLNCWQLVHLMGSGKYGVIGKLCCCI